MGRSECTRQRIFAFRHRDQVNMVGHETVAQDSRAAAAGVPG